MKIIIIGAGPGGYETALSAAAKGVETVLIESGEVGGTCLNEGCIPTKSFCSCAELMEKIGHAGAYGINVTGYSMDLQKVVNRKNGIVIQLRSGVEHLLGHRLIRLVRGLASFKDRNTVAVACESGQTEYFTGDYIIVATGSVPAALPVPGVSLPGVLTSREMLELAEVPEYLCVIGAGVIGLEFASVFRSFGSNVTVIEYAKEILPHFDSDLAKRLRQSLSRRGIDFRTGTRVQGVSQSGGMLEVECEKKGEIFRVPADRVLVAVGRKANVDSLNFRDIGIELNDRGVAVDDDCRTSVPNIFAVGDINGGLMLAHAASYQGRKVLDCILGVRRESGLSEVPAAVFTFPEAAAVGRTEEECVEKGLKYKVLKSFFRANGKAVSMGETEGFCKMIVEDAPDDEAHLLGCHMFGAHSSDIIQEVCVLISRKVTVSQVRSIVHTHPALTEVVSSLFFSS